MKEEQISIIEFEGGEMDFLNAEQDNVKLSKTGMFICKDGSATLSIDDTLYHLSRNSIIIYFSYSKLRILSYTDNLRGTVIAGNLEIVQPMLYNISNFNVLFAIKQMPHQTLTNQQMMNIERYVYLLKNVTGKLQEEEERLQAEKKGNPVVGIVSKQAELLGYSLMLEVMLCYANSAIPDEPFSRKDNALHKFVTSLYRHYRQEHSVGFYAEQQHLSPRYFCTLIKEQSGKSPSQWITTALLVDAQNLLKSTKMSIGEISDTLHFPTQSYFGKWFKNLTKMTPFDFRRGRLTFDDKDKEFSDVIQRGLRHVYNPGEES